MQGSLKSYFQVTSDSNLNLSDSKISGSTLAEANYNIEASLHSSMPDEYHKFFQSDISKAVKKIFIEEEELNSTRSEPC